MPRYFFDVNDGAELRDEIGRELTNGLMLRAEVIRAVAALLEDEANDFSDLALVLTVRDEAGATPFKVRMACQVEDL